MYFGRPRPAYLVKCRRRAQCREAFPLSTTTGTLEHPRANENATLATESQRRGGLPDDECTRGFHPSENHGRKLSLWNTTPIQDALCAILEQLQTKIAHHSSKPSPLARETSLHLIDHIEVRCQLVHHALSNLPLRLRVSNKEWAAQTKVYQTLLAVQLAVPQGHTHGILQAIIEANALVSRIALGRIVLAIGE